MKVLVLYPMFPERVEGLETLRGGPVAGDDVAGLLVGPTNRIGPEELERLPALRVIATASVGYDHVDLEAAAARGVWVCHVPDYCLAEVAETTLAYLLAFTRGLFELDRSVRAGGWDFAAAGPLRRLSDVRLGVVGFGRIGRAVTARALALGCEVWANDILVSDDEIAQSGARPASLDELLSACDAVSLHVPLTPATEGLIGAAQLARMRPDAVLLNTARGRVVDVDALVRALEEGRLRGAALDVLPEEPPPSVPQAPGLILTPHAAFYSSAAEQEACERAAAAVRAVLAGEEPQHAVAGPRA